MGQAPPYGLRDPGIDASYVTGTLLFVGGGYAAM